MLIAKGVAPPLAGVIAGLALVGGTLGSLLVPPLAFGKRRARVTMLFCAVLAPIFFIATFYGPVGVALCWELIRAKTVKRLHGKVKLVVGGSCWWTLPDDIPEDHPNRAVNLKMLQDAAPRIARLLSVYVRELSREPENRAKEHLRYKWLDKLYRRLYTCCSRRKWDV